MEEAEPDDMVPGGTDLAGLYALLHKTVKAQEREAFRQEQRWRSVQIHLNQFRDEFKAERRIGPWQPQGPDVPPPGPPQAGLGQPPAVAVAAAPAVPAAVPAGPAPTPAAWPRSAIPKMADEDDIEQYLTTYERLATAYRWLREGWAVRLVPYLAGKARGVFVAMDVQQALDCDQVKEAILHKYEINEEVYRRRFREPDIRPRELYTRQGPLCEVD
ncbi:hypothetical protein ACEWY4_010281 [Coilia grayii]|uniref:Uncharacterized protein n=1 Tax=Coilia grayii TaxID=363190 RepID=A0ABD1K1H1_9TELE